MTNIDRKEIEAASISVASEVGFIEPSNLNEELSSLYIVGGEVAATRENFCTLAKGLEERFGVTIDTNALLQNKRVHGGALTQTLQPQGDVQFPTIGHVANVVTVALQQIEDLNEEVADVGVDVEIDEAAQ
ncbi:hypothetical protein HOF56_02500 [Candidatus Peribacteria bacterium]|jgi:hypothetical protein|nr:hypothetical protein [Candidatus Peribacteria bacterium]MBT4021334.1 hypothetical protein [Candidatus Peribacteria bacterium]MBT4241205.1 hypothetical protein [Candidatus Peribacteria bacterium]MBT4474230.1 hypothetical protein [Candidatus Peribacteria bacterium]